MFLADPKVNLQIEKLIQKANKRFFLLLRYNRAGLPQNRLKDVYSSVMRSCLEYSVPVYHSQLNQSQTNMLEKVQKRCLKLIYGYDESYEELLKQSGLKSLEDRRIIIQFGKFVNNTVKKSKITALVPPNSSTRMGRHTNKYLEETSTQRLP